MFELVFNYNERNDSIEYAMSTVLDDDLAAGMTIPEAIKKAKTKFEDGHPYAFFYTMQLNFVPVQYHKNDNDEWEEL